MTAFEPTRSGVRAVLDETDVLLLQQVMTEMRELVDPAEPDPEPDAAADDGRGWARELGLTDPADGASRRPSDPVTARLFPDAYADAADSDEFRRFTEPELRRGKAAHIDTLLGSLPEGGGESLLDEPTVQAWLGALNDARLALGTALEITQDADYDLASLDLSSVRGQRMLVYGWLGQVQSDLLDLLLDG